jgi:ATP-binding cassette subfamily C protein LapB
MAHPPVDFRACLLAIAAQFGKETTISAALPDGLIDDATFRYLLDKAGLTADRSERLPDLELSIPFLIVAGSSVTLATFNQIGHVTLIGSEGSRTIPLADFSAPTEVHAYLMISAKRESPAISMFARYAWFWEPITRNSWAFVEVGLGTLMTNFLSLSVSIFMMVVYDRILPNKSYDSLVVLTIGVAIAIAFDFIIRQIRSHLVEASGQQIDMGIGRQLFDKIFEAKLEAFRGGVGAVANVFKEAEMLREFFTSASLMAFIDIPFTLLFIIVIYFLGGVIAIVPLLCIPLIVGFGAFVQPVLVQRAADSFTKGRAKQNVIVETLGGLETLRTMGAASIMRRRWMEGISQQAATEKGSRMLANTAVAFTAFVQNISQVIVLVMGVMMIGDGQLTMGALIASVMLTARCVAPLAQVANMLVRLNHARMAFAAVDGMMRAPVNRDSQRHYTRRAKLDGKIEFRNVSFAYQGSQQLTLSGVNFTINPGEKVAILGRVGSGKSTVAKLILNLYQPNDGAILFDSLDSRQVDPVDVQANISSLLQDVWLFSGTVRENILIGNPEADDDALLRVAKMATVTDFLAGHPLGFDMPVGERGAALSGGQRQSVGMARALVRGTSIYLFDEPTSMMDVRGEASLVAALKSTLKDETVIVITHRTTILDLVDRVIVLDQGRVVADGPKSILAAGGGTP